MSGGIPIAFSSVDRRCHDTGWHRTALSGAGPVWNARDDVAELVTAVWNSWSGNPTPPPVPPRLVDDGSEDSYAWALDRVLPPDPPPSTGPLFLDPSFGPAAHPGRNQGAGLTLGRDESLRFAEVPGAGKSVFCGSADGVVTRFVLNPATLGLEIAAQSVPLGACAFGLAVGDLSDGHAGLEVVVGTIRQLFVLDAATLGVLDSCAMPRGFEHSWPRRIQIADLIQTNDYVGRDIVLTTLMGHLLVFAGETLTEMIDFGEPGIQDLAVLEGLANPVQTVSENTPVLLLSHRGHLANVSLNPISDPTARNPAPAELQAWTPGEHGAPADLEIVDAPLGGRKLAVALYAHEGFDAQGNAVPQIRLFDALTLQPAALSTHGLPPGLGWKELQVHGEHISATDLAPIHLSGANGPLAGFVLLLGTRIAWVPANGSQPANRDGYKLDGFAPAARALAVITADLVTRPGGETYKEEIILSTLSGHLVWFHLEDLLANGNSEYLDSVGPAPVPPAPDTVIPHANQSYAGQWGLIAADIGQGMKLYGANQAGGLYETDPLTGVGTRRGVFRETVDKSPLSIRQPSTITAPIRDLAQIGGGLQPGRSAEAGIVSSNVPNDPLRWLETSPWEDLYNDIAHPWWVKGLETINGITVDFRSHVPLLDGLVAFVAGGDALASGAPRPDATRQLHWWGGDVQTFSNLIQGAFVSDAQLLDNWYSSKTGPYPWVEAPYPPSQSWTGRTSADCKDLRNEVRQFAQINNMQSLRVALDAHGPLVVGSSPGGSVVLLRPGGAAGQSGQDYGTVLWDSADQDPAWDEGLHAMGLALRPVPGDPNQALDIFLGIGVTHLDPSAWWAVPTPGPGLLSGGIAWYRWVSSSAGTGTMTRMGLLHLDPSTANAIGPRGGFHVCGLAVGDVVAGQPGDELVATTLEGDLFVFAIPSSGMISPAHILWRSWARGALGVNNGIVIHDFDNDGKQELYVAGSMGIWKWRQP